MPRPVSPRGAWPDVGHVSQRRAVGGQRGQTLPRCRAGQRGGVGGSGGGRGGAGVITQTYKGGRGTPELVGGGERISKESETEHFSFNAILL